MVLDRNRQGFGNRCHNVNYGDTTCQPQCVAAERKQCPKSVVFLQGWTNAVEFNAANGYPLHADLPTGDAATSSSPSFVATRRYRWENNRRPLRRLLLMLGIEDRRPIERRSLKQRQPAVP